MIQPAPSPKDNLIRILNETIHRIETGELVPQHLARYVPTLESDPEQLTGDFRLELTAVIYHVPWRPGITGEVPV